MSSLGTSVTDKKGPYLAFLDAYTRVNGRPPAEADMQRHFRVIPPRVRADPFAARRSQALRASPQWVRAKARWYEPSFSSPHGAHPRARRADPATARPRPKHRSVGRPQTPARPIPNPTGQFLRAEELALLWQVCGTEWTLAPCSAEGSRLE